MKVPHLHDYSACVQQLDNPLENYLSSAEQKANNVVYNAGSQGRGVAMEAGQVVPNGISAFRAAYKDSLKDCEAALSKTQECPAYRKCNLRDATPSKLADLCAGHETLHALKALLKHRENLFSLRYPSCSVYKYST